MMHVAGAARAVVLAAALLLAALGGPGAAQQMTADGLYVVERGQSVGPLSHADVERRIRESTLTAETMVWKPGMTDWAPARTVKEVAQLLNDRQAPPPPPPLDYVAFLEGNWESAAQQKRVEGVGLGTMTLRMTFNKLGTFDLLQRFDVPTSAGMFSAKTTGKGTFEVTRPTAESFDLELSGTSETTSNHPQGSVPEIGNIFRRVTIRVIDDNTIDDNGTILRRANY
ncbi:MAG: DUF4339 domain-containing protein [Roseovarius sp.]